MRISSYRTNGRSQQTAMANLRRPSDRRSNNKMHVECGKEIVHQRNVCVNKQHDRVWRARASRTLDKVNWSQHTCKCMCVLNPKWKVNCAEHSRIHRVHISCFASFVCIFFSSFSDIHRRRRSCSYNSISFDSVFVVGRIVACELSVSAANEVRWFKRGYLFFLFSHRLRFVKYVLWIVQTIERRAANRRNKNQRSYFHK